MSDDLAKLTRACAAARDAIRSGLPLAGVDRDRLGSEALPYLSLVRRGLRYAARSDSLDVPSADFLIGVEGFMQPDERTKMARARIRALSEQSPIATPHPDALLALSHLRTVLSLMPIIAPRLLGDWPLSAGLHAPRSGNELATRVFELEDAVSRLAAGSILARPETRRTHAYFEVAALRPEQLTPILAEMI